MSEGIFHCRNLGEWVGGCYRHLVGRGQRCSQTSYKAQEVPTKKYPARKVKSANIEKPCAQLSNTGLC